MKRPWALRTSQTRRLADDASKAGRHAHQDAMHPRRPRPRLALLAGLLLALAVPAAALAHPLGKFTINHYSGIRVSPERIVVDQVFDLAEIPALQALQPTGGDFGPAGPTAFAAGDCRQLVSGLMLSRSLLFSLSVPKPFCRVPPMVRSRLPSTASNPSRISSISSLRRGNRENKRFSGSEATALSETELLIW